MVRLIALYISPFLAVFSLIVPDITTAPKFKNNGPFISVLKMFREIASS